MNFDEYMKRINEADEEYRMDKELNAHYKQFQKMYWDLIKHISTGPTDRMKWHMWDNLKKRAEYEIRELGGDIPPSKP